MQLSVSGRHIDVDGHVAAIVLVPDAHAVLPVLMFRNRPHDRLNVVCRRSDGTAGWIDPHAATQTGAG